MSKIELLNYIERGLTRQEIMKKLNISERTLRRKMSQHEIKSPKGFWGNSLENKKSRWTEERRKKHSIRMSGENNPFYGKKHSDDTRQKMSENHYDCSGDKNPFKKSLKDPEKRKQHSERAKYRWRQYSPEELSKIKTNFSIGQCNNEYHKNNSSFKHHKHGHHSSNKCKKMFYRSSWELKFAEFLDCEEKVISYISEPFLVKYIDKNGVEKFTRPDFLVTLATCKILVEIKPVGLLKFKNNEQKINGLIEYCKDNKIKFKLVTKKELFSEGLLEYLISD